MTKVDPQELAYIAAAGTLIGIVEIAVGVVLSRAIEDSKKFLSRVLLGAGTGFLAAAAITYLARQQNWALIAGMLAFFCIANVGVLSGRRYLKKETKS